MRLPFRKTYNAFQNHASSNWPYLWRTRTDIPFIFGAINLLIAVAAPDFIRMLPMFGVSPLLFVWLFNSGLIIIFIIIICISAFGIGYWLLVTGRGLPLRELSSYSNSPSYLTLVIGLAFLAFAPLLFSFRLIWITDFTGTEPFQAFWNSKPYESVRTFFFIIIAGIVIVATFAINSRLTSLSSCFRGLLLTIILWISCGLAGALFYHALVKTVNIKDTAAFILAALLLFLPLYSAARAYVRQRQSRTYKQFKSIIIWNAPIYAWAFLVILAALNETIGAKKPAEIATQYGIGTVSIAAFLTLLNILSVMIVARAVSKLNLVPEE